MARNRGFLGAGAAAALSLAMWAAVASAAKPITEGSWKPVDFETLERGRYGVWAKPSLVAAGQECEWNTAMDAMEVNSELLVAPGPSAPVIDWGRKSLVLVGLGALSGGLGYEFEVTHVWSLGNRLMVDVRIQENPSMSIAETAPYHLFVVDTKAVGQVQVRYETSYGFPLLVSQRATCSGEATEVARGTWGTVKALYR